MENSEIEDRLQRLGTHPIAPALQSTHLTAMVPRGSRWGPKLRVAAAFLAGLLVGGSGLAAAGALPDPAQRVAHGVLDQVGIDVPNPERHHGPECGAEVKRNHGGYVRDDHDLAKSDCGKPVKGTGDEQDADELDDADEGLGSDKGPCQGPPPWAGKGKTSMTAEEKAAAQDERLTQCGDDEGEPDVPAPNETTP
ncbi:MAG: hypothetical protein ACT452_09220 [Microthrixaceae bacterium]